MCYNNGMKGVVMEETKTSFKCLCCQNIFDRVDEIGRNNMCKFNVLPQWVWFKLFQEHELALPNIVFACRSCCRKKRMLSLWTYHNRGHISEIEFLKIIFKAYKSHIFDMPEDQLNSLLGYIFFGDGDTEKKQRLRKIVVNAVTMKIVKPWRLLEEKLNKDTM